jgi:predicted nucleic-acid-binding Zn-ribbon protein
MAYTYPDIFRFLATKGRYKCSFCGNDRYLINSGLDIPGLENVPVEMQVPGFDPRPNGQAVNHRFFSIVCSNCGRTDLFHGNQYDAWLRQDPSGAS